MPDLRRRGIQRLLCQSWTAWKAAPSCSALLFTGNMFHSRSQTVSDGEQCVALSFIKTLKRRVFIWLWRPCSCLTPVGREFTEDKEVSNTASASNAATFSFSVTPSSYRGIIMSCFDSGAFNCVSLFGEYSASAMRNQYHDSALYTASRASEYPQSQTAKGSD